VGSSEVERDRSEGFAVLMQEAVEVVVPGWRILQVVQSEHTDYLFVVFEELESFHSFFGRYSWF